MELKINGDVYTIPDGQSTRMLVWVLRDELGLIETKYGCGAGICGACTVLLDGRTPHWSGCRCGCQRSLFADRSAPAEFTFESP
jgi:aerobic-type carbon monoxide dehydrogenase small subunit (CoxS/CutS family)